MRKGWMANACAGSLVLLSLLGLQSLPGHAAPADCETLRDQDAFYDARSAAPYKFMDFALGVANQRARRPVLDEIGRRFGSDTKADSSLRLSRGLIGVALDYDRQALAVVVDPRMVDGPSLQQALNREAVAGSRANPGSVAIPVRVIESCFAAQDLVATYEALRGQKALDGLLYGYSLNQRNSTWEIYTFSHAKEAEEFAQQQGGRVTVVPIDIGPGSDDRYNDRQPHWGGARIERRTDGRFCSSAFTVNSENSAEGQAHVTAAHCFLTGQVVDSGPFYFGNVIRRPNFPNFDTALINASDQNYDDNIYDGVNDTPAANAENIDIVGTDTVAETESICVSGAVSRRVCGVVVERLNGVCPQGGGETTGLIIARKVGAQVFVNGDSGGPMYTRTNGNRIVGMNVCGVDEDRFPNGPFDMTFAEKWRNIELNLDVCVANSPSYEACTPG